MGFIWRCPPSSEYSETRFWNWCSGQCSFWERSEWLFDSILYELMLDRTHELPKERENGLLGERTGSDTIQSEVIQQYACTIQREVVSRAAKSHQFQPRRGKPHFGVVWCIHFFKCCHHAARLYTRCSPPPVPLHVTVLLCVVIFTGLINVGDAPGSALNDLK